MIEAAQGRAIKGLGIDTLIANILVKHNFSNVRTD